MQPITKPPTARLSAGHQFADDDAVMHYALALAKRGTGLVEPNPAVGAVIVDAQRRLIADGHHERFGDAHAEVNAIRSAGSGCHGASLFVTLEPCSHHGKTPPCADAVIAAGFQNVFVGCSDPAPHVAGQGIARIRAAGIEVIEGICRNPAERLIAPFRMLHCNERPWVHAKWAMTLDGRIATFSGHSQWISCSESRAYVHKLRGRMDAIITGAGTVRADDPQLTARPAGPRTPLRVILDAGGESVTPGSALVRTLDQADVLVCAGPNASIDQITKLQQLGVQILQCPVMTAERIDVRFVLQELGKRGATNVLLEAGAGVLGAFFDLQLIDELHAFIAPKLVGGTNAKHVIGGTGLHEIPPQSSLSNVSWLPMGTDMLCHGDILRQIRNGVD